MSLLEEFKKLQLGWDYGFFKNILEPYIDGKDKNES